MVAVVAQSNNTSGEALPKSSRPDRCPCLGREGLAARPIACQTAGDSYAAKYRLLGRLTPDGVGPFLCGKCASVTYRREAIGVSGKVADVTGYLASLCREDPGYLAYYVANVSGSSYVARYLV